MAEEAPSGYITMTAGEIAEAAAYHIKVRMADQKEWDAKLPDALLKWRTTQLNWLGRIWHWDLPKDGPALAKWWYSFEWPHQRPDVGVGDRPYPAGFIEQWDRRMKFIAADSKVFIDVEDASVLKSWLLDKQKKEAAGAGQPKS